MKTPKTLKIKGKTWKVRHKINLCDDEGNFCYGLCDYDKKDIFLRSGLSDKQKTLALIHELFHATLHECHINLDFDIDEAICDSLSTILTEMFHIRVKKK